MHELFHMTSSAENVLFYDEILCVNTISRISSFQSASYFANM